MDKSRHTDCTQNCVVFARADERIKTLEDEREIMWKKIDMIVLALGAGKNWIISILVVLSLNLVGVVATLAITWLRTSAS